MHKAPPTNPVHEGDLICGECGEGNPPTRRFCSRCGASLHLAAPVHLPWWRKIFPKRVKKAGADAAAAAKKKKKKGSTGALGRNIRRVIGAILLVSGIVYASVPAVRSYVNDKTSAAITKVESIVRPQYVPTHPVEVNASGANNGHPASAITDGFTNTYWSAPTTGPEQVVTMRFEQPTSLDKALIRVGISGNFASANRPQNIHVVYSTGKSQDLKLEDTADAQEVELKSGGKTSTVELHITSLFRAVNSPDVAITEIELFTKK